MNKWELVVMGVSGCGKSTVGKMLAEKLGARFIDGDDLHPASNVAKMASGIPLNDDDRWPWLQLVGEAVAGAPNAVDGFTLVQPTGTVVAASSLKKIYRDRIREAAGAAGGTAGAAVATAADPGSGRVFFVHLTGSRELLWQRMTERANHFMKPELLDSQLAILEALAEDELGATFDISLSPNEIVEQVLARLT